MQAVLPTPFGSVLVTVDERDRVRSVDLSPQQAEPRRPDGFPEAIEGAFEAYLAGRAARPEVPVGEIDATDFQRSVCEALTAVPPGEPVTYGDLARRIGKPGAARAVGQALGRNPLPLVWPCHRVVASDGLGGFGGAREADDSDKLAMKRWLLEHERAHR